MTTRARNDGSASDEGHVCADCSTYVAASQILRIGLIFFARGRRTAPCFGNVCLTALARSRGSRGHSRRTDLIGLVFVFATFAALVSVLTEAIGRLIGLRGEYLLRGIRSLVDGPSDFELPMSDIFVATRRSPHRAQTRQRTRW